MRIYFQTIDFLGFEFDGRLAYCIKNPFRLLKLKENMRENVNVLNQFCVIWNHMIKSFYAHTDKILYEDVNDAKLLQTPTKYEITTIKEKLAALTAT